MDKLYAISKLLREQNQKLNFIEESYRRGMVTGGEAFDETIDICKEYDEKIKAIINEPVKVSKKQFMLEQKMLGMNIN